MRSLLYQIFVALYSTYPKEDARIIFEELLNLITP